jgi:signal transduction histidine kinase
MAARLQRDMPAVGITTTGRPRTQRMRSRAMKAPREEREQRDPTGLEGLVGLAKAILSVESPEAVGEAAVRHLHSLIDAQHISVVLFDSAAAQSTVVAAFSKGEVRASGGSRWSLDAFGPHDGFVAGKTIAFEDLAAVPGLPAALGSLARAGIRALLEIPLSNRSEQLGAILVGSTDAGRFAPFEIQTLTQASEILAIAMRRAGRVERAVARSAALERSLHDHRTLLSQAALSQEQERHRLAVDIHDDSVQVMTVASMRLHSIRGTISDPALGARLDEVQTTVRMATDRLRHLMFELLPPTLEREGLGPAISLYLRRTREEAGIAFLFESRIQGQPPAETRTAIYRIAQEAVRNVVEHARASTIDVLLERRDDGVWVRVGDDGVGFSVEEVDTRLPMHLGLHAMRQHAEMAGGWCRIHSGPGEGTTVEAWVPGEPASLQLGREISAKLA